MFAIIRFNRTEITEFSLTSAVTPCFPCEVGYRYYGPITSRFT
ncbi:23033_t:CDS:1, partial [Gigaspora margarita]